MKNKEKLFFKSGYVKDFEVEISIDNPTLWQKLTKQYIRKYKVKNLVLEKNLRITDVLIDIPNFTKDFYKEIEQPANAIKFMNEHTEKLAEIVAILLEEKPSFILKNLTNENILDLMQKIVSLLGVESFFQSMGLTKMEMSLKKD